MSLGTQPSGGQASPLAFSATASDPAVVVPPPANRGKPWRWTGGGAAVLLAGVGGAVGYVKLTPPTAPPAAGPGLLPEVRPVERVVPTRERELLALVQDADTPPAAGWRPALNWGCCM